MWTPDQSLIVTTAQRADEARVGKVAAVKAECRRRILVVMDEDQQRNALAAGQAAVMEYGPDPLIWPSDLREFQASAMAAWNEISRLRARSNEIESMDPIPVDLEDDRLWHGQHS